MSKITRTFAARALLSDLRFGDRGFTSGFREGWLDFREGWFGFREG